MRQKVLRKRQPIARLDRRVFVESGEPEQLRSRQLFDGFAWFLLPPTALRALLRISSLRKS